MIRPLQLSYLVPLKLLVPKLPVQIVIIILFMAIKFVIIWWVCYFRDFCMLLSQLAICVCSVTQVWMSFYAKWSTWQRQQQKNVFITDLFKSRLSRQLGMILQVDTVR